jgi:tetratricopeptide (TPR) repeat protein
MSNGSLPIRILWIMAIVSAPAWGQVGRDARPSTTPPPGRAADGDGDPKAQKGLSEADGRTYARSVIEAVEAGDRASFNALVDWDTLLSAVVAGRDIPEGTRREMIVSLRKGIDGEAGYTAELFRTVEQGGTLAFLRMRQREGRPTVLFRLLRTDEVGGLAYSEFILRRLPDGRVRATDIYFYSMQRLFSEELRRIVSPVLAQHSRSVVDKLLNEERDYAQELDQLGRASKLLGQGKPREAMAIYNKLHPRTRTQRAVLLAHLRAAQQAGDEKECAAIREELRKQFPDNAYLQMLAIDELMVKKDYAGAMKVLDRLDQSLGGDPYLDAMRSTYALAHGDAWAARRFARRAIEREPSLIEGYWALVDCALKAEDHEETLARLEEIDRKFGIEFQDLNQVPQYAGFVKSPQHARWLDYLKSKNAARKSPPAGDHDDSTHEADRLSTQKPGADD